MRTVRSLACLSAASILALTAGPSGDARATSLLPGAGDGPKSREVEPDKRDFGEIKFSVEADIKDHIRYTDQNYSKSTRRVRFDGVVRLKYVYGGGTFTEGAPAELLDTTLPPERELQFIMEGFSLCEKETDAAKMGACTGDATRAGQEKFAKCNKANAAERLKLGCGGGSAGAPPPFMGDFVGGSKGKDRFDPNEEKDVRFWQPMTCSGGAIVSGLGEGYDSTWQRDPAFKFKISGNWTADPRAVGSSGGCAASALINVKTGEVKLSLLPGPVYIQTQYAYDNYRGTTKVGERAFEEIEGMAGVVIDLKIPPGSKSFQGSWRPPATSSAKSTSDRGRTVETIVNYSFSHE